MEDRMRAPLLLIPAVLLAGIASPARAFDCARARTPLEKTICADPAARQADDAMGAAYIVVQAASGKAESQIRCIQIDFRAYGTFYANHANILHQD
jgi:uncharacterized protein